MKSLTKCLLAGTLTAAAIFCWSGSLIPGNQSDNGKKLVLLRKNAPLDRGQSLEERLPAKSALSPAETRALIHLKLHQWLEVQASGGDDNDHSMEELKALLAKGDAVDIIQSLSADELNTPFGMDVLNQWAQSDLVSATNWVASNAAAMEDLTAVVAQQWASDPADLEDYLDQIPEGSWKQNFLLETGSQLTAKNPSAAVILAQQMTPGSGQTNFLQTVAGDWINSDPTAALDWIRNVDDSTLREQLIAAAAKSYALTNPDQAANWLVSTVKSPDLVNDAALNILSNWVTQDPKGAANWATLLPEGDTKSAATALVSSHWLQTDPQSASLWMQSFPSKL